jgi:prepilin-type N-terminal cleavage/methylation domain-containing protein
MKTRAFTLIEILLATAIFAIVLLSITTVFFAALRLRERTTAAVDDALPLNRALGILRRDLQNAMPPGGPLAGSFRYGQGSGGFGGSSGGTANSSSSAAQTVAANSTSLLQNGLDFYTTTGHLGAGAPWGEIQEVNYDLKTPSDPKAYGRDLVRTVNRDLLAVAAQTPETQRLVSNVQSLDFSFWDGAQWRDTWDTTAGDTNLPLAVKVSLQLAVDPSMNAGRQEPVQMVVLLDTQVISTNAASTNSTTEGME